MADSYVCSGAILKCACGLVQSPLVVPPSRTVCLAGKPPMANIIDNVVGTNISNFGTCYASVLPTPCSPNVTAPWQNGKTDYLVRNNPALLKSSTCICNRGGIISIIDDGQKGENPWVEKQPCTVCKSAKCPRCIELTEEQLRELFPQAKIDRIQSVIGCYKKYALKFKIDSCLRKAHFWAQVREEAGPWLGVQESLNYSAKALYSGYPFKIFKGDATRCLSIGRTLEEKDYDGVPTKEKQLEKHRANQEAIANIAYANRLGNGDAESGDGWRYRGGGLIQITGKNNYSQITKIIKETAPELIPKSKNGNILNADDLGNIDLALASTMAYWMSHNLITISDNGSNDETVNNITAIINKGTDSYLKRRSHFMLAKQLFKTDECEKNKNVTQNYNSSYKGVNSQTTKSEIGSTTPLRQPGQESMMIRQVVNIRVFFSIFKNGGRVGTIEDVENNVSEYIVLQDIFGKNNKQFGTDGIINTTKTYDCTELLIDDSGQCSDDEGKYGIITSALYDIAILILELKDRMPIADIHLFIYGFKLLDDLVQSFAYLVGNHQSIATGSISKELLSWIHETPTLSELFCADGYSFKIDYVGEFEYHQLFQPVLDGNEGIDITIEPKQTSKGTISMPLVDVGIHNAPTLYGNVQKSDVDLLETTQLGLDVASLMPVVGEVSSLVNGFIYLGREFKSGCDGDIEKMNQYKKEAIYSFLGAIPGSSLLKGAAKVYKVGRAVNKAKNADKVAVAAKKALDISSQAIEKANRSQRMGHELLNLTQGNKNKVYAKVLANIESKNAQKALESSLKGAGMTLGESLDVSAEMLRHPSFYMRFGKKTFDVADNLGSLPKTNFDNAVDGLDYIRKIFFETPKIGKKINNAIDDNVK